MSKRIATDYPGVFYREARRIGGKGLEKVFYVVFKKDGKVFEEKAGREFADAMTAARAAGFRAERIEGKRHSRKEIREEKRAAREAEASRWTIDRLWEAYRAQRPDSKSVRIDTGRYKLYLKDAFGDREPHELGQLEVDRLRIGLLKRRRPQTTKHVLALLKRIVNFGVSRGLARGPRFQITLPKVSNTVTEDLTEEQLQALLMAIDEDHDTQVANLMRLVLYTGLRRGECFKLQWRDVNFERGFITISDPKGVKDQVIPMNDGAREVLMRHPRTEGSPFVFPGRGGGPRVDVNKAVNRIKAAAGLPKKNFRPLHGLRHAFASMLASSGQVDLYALQRLLTHKSPEMTQRYAHLRDEALKRASDVARALIGKAANGKKKEAAEDQTA
jgi:integrase